MNDQGIIGVQHVYVTDYGTFTLRPGALEREASLRQRVKWKQHRDDLIGVPEVVVDNDLIAARMQRKARKLWEAGLPVR